MFEISVEKDFDAAHFLRGYQGKCESLHGHRFKVVVTVSTDKTNDIGLAYDFTELKRNMGEVLSGYDHVCLNEIAPFKKINPSSENIATAIYTALKKQMKNAPVKITAVEVRESPQSHVVYRPD
jgi:6-pyruvoyltetrahydropterin/6-carboxytetrahydropterin synthase